MTQTKEQLRELASVIIAWCDGKIVQWRRLDGLWEDLRGTPEFHRMDMRWRIKPERKERWVLEYTNGVETVHKSIVQAKANAGIRGVITRFIQADEVAENQEADKPEPKRKPYEAWIAVDKDGIAFINVSEAVVKSWAKGCPNPNTVIKLREVE